MPQPKRDAATASGPRDRTAWLAPLTPESCAVTRLPAGNAPFRIRDEPRDTSGTSTIGRCHRTPTMAKPSKCRRTSAPREAAMVVEHKGWGDECPLPACRSVRPMAGFVSVENRNWYRLERLSQLNIRRRHSVSRLFRNACCVLPRLSGICKTSASNRLHDQARSSGRRPSDTQSALASLRAELTGALVGLGRLSRACPAGWTGEADDSDTR